MQVDIFEVDMPNTIKSCAIKNNDNLYTVLINKNKQKEKSEIKPCIKYKKEGAM